jgi:DNA replication protein DnaC
MKNASLDIMLKTLNLTSALSIYRQLAGRAATESWSYEQYLQALVEDELEARSKRRTERLLKLSCLPHGKNLATLKMEIMPHKVRTMLPNLLDGGFAARAENILLFGLPGRGKTHLAAAIGYELVVRHAIPVFFTTTFSLVQRLLRAKAELCIYAEFAKLDKFEVIILDDIGYVQQSREEMEILFTFMGERYERKSLIVTSNLVFSQWDGIFKDPMTTAAAIDRLVHHSVILEMTGKSKRLPFPEEAAEP